MFMFMFTFIKLTIVQKGGKKCLSDALYKVYIKST